MTAIAQQLLPLGFRFHPTDEELINHYLKRKITGRIKHEAEVIPEVDVCKCEPWDLPDKSIIRSDDPEWFFFAPKDRKYANGHRSNRATVAGYWKATGKDRVIRSKAAAAGHNMIGMKKTLVFHRGRAPKGTRTHWIMHEYRTTEPEFESGVQGGYVLYRLFKKNEERSSNSRADEMERGCFSPAQARLSPGDTQHEEDVMEEITGPLNPESSESVLQEEPHSLPDVVEQQPAVMHADPLQDSSPQYHHPQYEKIDSNGFPNISSPVLPNTDHRIDPGYDSDDDQDINEFLDAILSTQDECSSGASNVQKDSIAETVSRSSIWDSASFRDSGTSSEIDAEATLPQELLGLEASKGLEGSPFLSNDALQMNSLFGYPEIEPQLSALYEHATLLPYDSTGPDVCSEDITAESLQDLFKSMRDDGGGLEATGIKFRARQPQHPSNLNNMFELQGTAARRFRLQAGTLNSSMWSADSESSSNRDDHEDKEALKKALQDLYDSTEGSLTQKNTPSTEDGFEATGIKIRVRQAQHPPSLPQKQGMAARRICLQTHLEVGTFPSTVSESSKHEDDHDDEVSATETEEHVDDNIAEFVGLSKPSSPDRHKLEQLSGHDNTAPDSELYLESKPMLRLRTKWTGDNANISDEPPPSRRRTPRTASVVYVIGLVLSVILVLMCVGIWRSMNSQRM